MHKTTVLLVDDHDILMEGIASLLAESVHIEVIGKASSPAAAEALIRQQQPDILLTDISMGAVSGIELTKSTLQRYPSIGVIILSMHDDVQYITAAFDAGARGYLLKNVKGEELFRAIGKVAGGGTHIQTSLAPQYARARRQVEEAVAQSPLSPREIEIIRLIAKDLTTAEISKQLFISEHTVETHRKNIGRKTGTKTAVGVLNYAREHNLL